MATHNTARPAGPAPRVALGWVLASVAGAVAWVALVAASPPGFFGIAAPFCAVWALVSARAAPKPLIPSVHRPRALARPEPALSVAVLSKGRGAEGLGMPGGSTGPEGARKSRRSEDSRTRRTRLADLALGVGSGVLLYVASRAFLLVACGPFSRALCGPLSRMFERFETRTIVAALVLGLVLAPAEELFWRGVLQARLAGRLGAVRAVIVATLLAAVASLVSGEPFLALAMLPTYGAWGALAAWRRSLLAPIASHATWSVLVASLLPPM